MGLKINVPYSEKDSVKQLGARWDAINKTWYVPDNVDFCLFHKWFSNIELNIIAKRPVFIGLTKVNCWKCKNITPVISICSDTYYLIEALEKEKNDEFSFFSYVSFIGEEAKIIIEKHFPYYRLGFSKTTNSKYWANHCIHCNSLQGDFFLHDEPYSPFFPMDEVMAKKLKLIRLPLNYDLDLIGESPWSNAYDFIIENSKRVSIEEYLKGLEAKG